MPTNETWQHIVLVDKTVQELSDRLRALYSGICLISDHPDLPSSLINDTTGVALVDTVHFYPRIRSAYTMIEAGVVWNVSNSAFDASDGLLNRTGTQVDLIGSFDVTKDLLFRGRLGFRVNEELSGGETAEIQSLFGKTNQVVLGVQADLRIGSWDRIDLILTLEGSTIMVDRGLFPTSDLLRLLGIDPDTIAVEGLFDSHVVANQIWPIYAGFVGPTLSYTATQRYVIYFSAGAGFRSQRVVLFAVHLPEPNDPVPSIEAIAAYGSDLIWRGTLGLRLGNALDIRADFVGNLATFANDRPPFVRIVLAKGFTI
jgi:hypothetical protein